MLDLSAVLVTNFSGDDSFRIFGDGDVETITGSSADDVIEGGAGGDTLDGGAHGTKGDTLSYASSTSGVDVALETGGASGGDAAGDTISGFENLTGSAHADALYGKICRATLWMAGIATIFSWAWVEPTILSEALETIRWQYRSALPK
ncbi:MAG: hypothetical protein R3D89_12125 [Sphingomonadaceae bacterium]